MFRLVRLHPRKEGRGEMVLQAPGSNAAGLENSMIDHPIEGKTPWAF